MREQARPALRPPAASAKPGRQEAEPGQRQGQGVLGHRSGVGTFGAGPDSGLVNHLGHRLHAGRRQLDPAHTRSGCEGLCETPDVVRIEPDQGLWVIGQVHHRPAAALDRLDGKGGGIRRNGHPVEAYRALSR